MKGREQLALLFAITVDLIWAVVAVSSMFTKDYTGLSIVTPVMLLATGFVFGFKVEKRRNGNNA
jgi:hypothetical protein